MRLMYVFNPVEAEGYLFRAPELIARWYCKRHRGFGYAPSEFGL